MRKRLRKKKRLGEFTEYGFYLGIWLHDESNHDKILDWWFKAQELWHKKWCLGGGVPRWLFVCRWERNGTATEASRDAFCEELAQRPEVAYCRFSRLYDANGHEDITDYDAVCCYRKPEL